MDRRYYLGVLATGLLAGCGGTESVEPPTETEPSPEATAPEPTTPEATDSPTAESDTSAESDTERETETMYPLSEVPEPEVEEES